MVVAEGDTLHFMSFAPPHNIKTVADHATWTACTLTDAVVVTEAAGPLMVTVGNSSAHYVCSVGCATGQKLMVMVGGTCPTAPMQSPAATTTPADSDSGAFRRGFSASIALTGSVFASMMV